MIDFKKFNSLPWLESRTIFLTKHGSHAYGLNTPTSDLDIKGVAIPPKEYFFGFLKRFEQAESQDDYCDLVIYDIRKFFNLAADCNPNIIEVLWTDPFDHIKNIDLHRWYSVYEHLIDNRWCFISKKAKHTFSGYAISQLKRINTHHRWLIDPPKAPPTRAEYGLPERTVIPKDQLAAAESAIRKKVDSWSFDFDGVDSALRQHILNQVSDYLVEINVNEAEKFNRAARAIGYDENFILLLDNERKYTTKLREWQQYQNWKATRNEARAELEGKYGYDTKHAMHLVRLMRMCREILETGKVNVKRVDDKEELLAIRRGAWSYDQLMQWAVDADEALNEVYAKSMLKKEPDREKLDRLCMEIVEESFE